ncbi:MAG: type II secretion system F family protein [Rhodospirillales bacterium]|nr:type II secretion system F family protein [Rhodospirillales bacterium]
MNAETLTIFAGVLVSLICIGAILRGGGSGTRTPIGKRAEKVRIRATAAANLKPTTSSTSSVKRQDRRSTLPTLDKLAKRLLPRQDALYQRLHRTGRDIGIGFYIAISFGLAFVVTAVLTVMAQMPIALSIALGIFAGAAIPHLVVNRMATKRLERFTGIFPDAIDLIVRGLRSGLPVTESISAVGSEMPDPVGGEFRRIAESVQFGRTLEEALWDAARRLDTPDFKFFVISLSVQKETGGNLGETLANLSDVLRRRRQMKLKIKAMSSEARASAYILGSLPFVMFCLIYLLNPSYETELFTDPRGRVALLAAMAKMAVGIAVMRKMVRFEF